MPKESNYAKPSVVTQHYLRKLIILTAAACIPASIACSKDSQEGKKKAPSAYKDIEKPFDKTEPPQAERKPVQGVDVSTLEKPMAVRFEALADQLPSPCGKAHSLRTSRNTDASCKRAPFAVDYTFSLVKDGATNEEVKEMYALRFRDTKVTEFNTIDSIPHHGPTDATVKIVEFYDYGCPACSRFKPVIEEALKGIETEVVVFYKQFPLSAHVDSPGAAQAALAANAQGKFMEMHSLLFANQHDQKMSDLKKYATQIQLDMKAFQKDYDAAAPLVEVDRKEGEAAGITGTPSIYINGRLYEGPSHPKYFRMWLDESLAEAI